MSVYLGNCLQKPAKMPTGEIARTYKHKESKKKVSGYLEMETGAFSEKTIQSTSENTGGLDCYSVVQCRLLRLNESLRVDWNRIHVACGPV